MQLVFVHGVNVRKGELYEKEVEFRNRNFADIFFRQLGHEVPNEAITNPYWGDLGADISADQPFLPRGSYEMLWRKLDHLHPDEEGAAGTGTGTGTGTGPGTGTDAAAGGSEGGTSAALTPSEPFAPLDPNSRTPLLDIARTTSMADVIDVIWDLLDEEADEHKEESASYLAKLAQKALSFSHSEEGLKWLKGAKSDDELIEKLSGLLKEDHCEDEAATETETDAGTGTGTETGTGQNPQKATRLKTVARAARERIRNRFKNIRERLHSRTHKLRERLHEDVEAARLRIRQTTVGTTARLFNNPMRAIFHQECALLIGDAFAYFSTRGDESTPSPIARRVIEAIEEAAAKRDEKGGKLVVVGHSMGGVILCDILTCYGKHIPIDVVITVGSQFPLFADLRMFPGVNPDEKPVPKPENIGEWINIFDPHDFLGYPASHLFDGVTDYHLPTYALGGAAHRNYFNRRSFYYQLARRLSDRMR